MKPFQADGSFHFIDTSGGLRRTAVRGAVATITGSAGNFVLAIGSVVILARLLTPSDFGVVTMVTTFSLLLRSFGLNGFTELIIQRDQITEALASNLFWINVGVGALLTVAFACSGPLLALFFHNTEVVRVTQVMSLTILVGSFGYIHFGLLQRAMRFRTTAIIYFAGQAIQVIVSIALATQGWRYWALVWGSVGQTLAVAAGSWFTCHWIPRFPTRRSGTRGGVIYALNVYSHFAFLYLTRNTDNFLVGWRFGASALGLYKRAYDLFVLPETQLMAPVTAVVVGTLSRIRHDRVKYQAYFLRGASILAFVGMAISADFTLVGVDIIRFLFGAGWEEAGRIFVLFSPGIGVGMLYVTHGWIHLSIGTPDRWFRWGVLDFCLTATLFMLGLHWGPSGVALAWTSSYFLLLVPGLAYAGKPINLRIGAVVAAIWKFFAASVAAGVGTTLIIKIMPHIFVPRGGLEALLRIAIVSLVFLVLYTAGVIALHRGLAPLTQAAGLLREVLPQRIPSATIPGVDEAEELLANASWSRRAEPKTELAGSSDNALPLERGRYTE